MVLPSSAFELGRQAQHWHGGDDWRDMEEVTPSHDAAQSDPERSWKGARIFRCTACEEQFRVFDPANAPAGEVRPG